jgi:hypothetical protein
MIDGMYFALGVSGRERDEGKIAFECSCLAPQVYCTKYLNM